MRDKNAPRRTEADRYAEYEMLKHDVVAGLKDKSPANVDRALRELRRRLKL